MRDALLGQVRFAVDVKNAPPGADRVGRDQHAFDGSVRVALKQVPILEDARLAFLGVDNEPLRLTSRRPTAQPLHGGRKVGPTAADQAGGLHLGNRVLLRRAIESPRQRGVAAPCKVAVDALRIDLSEVTRDKAGLASQERRAGACKVVGLCVRPDR